MVIHCIMYPAPLLQKRLGVDRNVGALMFCRDCCGCDNICAVQEDFMKAVRKIAENKKLEGKVEYAKI